MIVPPFAGVRLVEYRDRIALTPLYWCREFVGMGRFKANEVGFQSGEDMFPLYNAIMGDNEIRVIVSWQRYEDGREEVGLASCLDPEATEAEARKVFARSIRFLRMSKEKLEVLEGCFKATEEDHAYIESRFPNVKAAPDPKSTDEYDLYQARLKVLAGMQPNTVGLLKQADVTKDPQKREKIEREAVEAYFADMATYWPENVLKDWLRSNPAGSKWLGEFASMMQKPERELDPVDLELVLNWLRRGYNLLTESELSDAILTGTGQRLKPGTIKKRRVRLGLTTKRQPGPRPKSEQ
jgi:hypothetical protein